MKKYLIYRNGAGGISALEVINEQEDKDAITRAGRELLRPSAIVGESEADVISRFEKAEGMRGEGKKIAETYATPQSISKLQSAKEAELAGIDEAQEKSERMQEAQAYGSEQAGKLGAGALLRQMGSSVPKLATSAYEAIVNPDPELGRLQTFADRYQLPYQGDLAESILGDPTLVPGALVPGVGEAKIASVLGKLGRYAIPTAKAVEPALNAGIQSTVASMAPGTQDISGGTLAGSALGYGGKVAGKALKGVGGKIITSTVKPKIGGQWDVNELMGATNVDGSKVVKPFSSVEGTTENVLKSLEDWSSIQGQSIPEGKVDIFAKIQDLRDKYALMAQSGAFTENQYKKVLKVLDEEEGRFKLASNPQTGPSYPMAQPDYASVHTAKTKVGKLGKYDLQDPNKLEPVEREVYRDLYPEYADILGGPEGSAQYKQATEAMVPMMGAKKELEKADERIGKNNIIPLTSMMAMAGMGGATQSVPAALVAGAIPWLTQGMRTGTGAYRAGEVAPTLARYAMPLAVRSVKDEKKKKKLSDYNPNP